MDRGSRRYQTYLKAKRKQDIVHELYDYWYYPAFGYYRKGKIHCSCPMCSAKTNSKINKSRGPVDSSRNFCRMSTTNSRYGKKNYKISELKNVMSMLNQLEDYS